MAFITGAFHTLGPSFRARGGHAITVLPRKVYWDPYLMELLLSQHRNFCSTIAVVAMILTMNCGVFEELWPKFRRVSPAAFAV